ncbi:MAG: hypothetical protein ACJ8HJ_00290 [Massilia sp.]|jgi:hypothetical protein
MEQAKADRLLVCMAATSSGPPALAGAPVPRRIFTMTHIACTFCGLQEIHVPAISLRTMHSLCFQRGIPRAPVAGAQQRGTIGAVPLSSAAAFRIVGQQMDGIIADFDDPAVTAALSRTRVPRWRPCRSVQ